MPDQRQALASRFAAYLGTIHPAVMRDAEPILADLLRQSRADRSAGGQWIEELRQPFGEKLGQALLDAAVLPEGAAPPTVIPGFDPAGEISARVGMILEDCDGFLHREAIQASLTGDERRDILQGMITTREVDNQLKRFFLKSEVRYQGAQFQGKGFRSLGQEAIYAAPLRFRRGPAWAVEDGGWNGDVVAPMIRDLGAALAMARDDQAIGAVLSAQMGKSGPPMDGKDFHIGDFNRGVLPPTAPLSIPTLTMTGLAMAFQRERSGRIAVSFIGEGGSSLGEWHEAINLCAARKLPAVFCIENNQTALSTPVSQQSAARAFADKARGYGIPGVTLDGTDPDAIASAFAWAAERAREGKGPALIELISMRMCGHAHHDDMLYLGKEPAAGWGYPEPTAEGYADHDLYAQWAAKDPIPSYAARLLAEGVLEKDDLDRFRTEAERQVREQTAAVVQAPWPKPEEAGRNVFAGEADRTRVEILENRILPGTGSGPAATAIDPGPAFDPKGATFLEAVMIGIRDALEDDEKVFLYGEDIGGRYGNAFLLLRPLLEKFGDRILNSTLAEGGILGVCTGAALAGQRPIGEIQFNDFIASGFNQLVNNASMIRYRWGGSVPMVVRMPWGGLRHAGPYHSQNTEPWFYRTPGLKIVTPSTPYDARALMLAAVRDPDPVLFYEHIALYRNPRIRQRLEDSPPEPMEIGKGALRRAGDDLLIVSYGAYVHHALRVAERLGGDGIDCSVLDLRSLVPLDKELLLAAARNAGKVLIVQEDSRTGGIGESLAAIIQEEAFEFLDAPVRILGALDTPVPYSPPLEEAYLVSESEMEKAARLLAAY